MPDVFGRASSLFGGAMKADDAKISFSGGAGGIVGGGVGLLTQQAQFSYNQQITRLYEVGSSYEFFIAGRTQGQLSLARILGPRAVQTAFYSTYGDVCKAAQNSIAVSFAQGACGAPEAFGNTQGTVAINLKSVVLVSIGMSVGAQDMIINEQVSAMFVSMEIG